MRLPDVVATPEDLPAAHLVKRQVGATVPGVPGNRRTTRRRKTAALLPITSSARSSTVCGMAMPRAFAVFMLMVR